MRPDFRRVFWVLCSPLFSFFILTGCASDRYLYHPGHSRFYARDYKKAAELYSKDALKPGANQFLFLVDHAMSLFAAGEFESAIPVFLQAEKIGEIKDYTSISEEVGSLATSEAIKGYKGEDFEKVLINVYLALCFAALDKWESAQVEARKINLLLYRMINEGKRNYQESPFARYLAAMLWESTKEWNSAYIDYKKTFELDPTFPELGSDLLGASKKMRFEDEFRLWGTKFPSAAPRKLEPNQGEIIAVFEQGMSPKKIPRDGEHSSLPRFIRRYSPSSQANVVVGDKVYSVQQRVLDIETLSINYLEDRIGRMIAKKIASAAVKGAIAAGVGTSSKDSDLGVAVFYLLMAMDRADLRSWLTLPAGFWMARIPVEKGEYPVKMEILDRAGNVIYVKDFGVVKVKPNSKKFIVGR
jgi:hypothetical protein